MGTISKQQLKNRFSEKSQVLETNETQNLSKETVFIEGKTQGTEKHNNSSKAQFIDSVEE